jgi:hypothetical protein
MSALTDDDRRWARQVVAAMPEWTKEQLAELARITEATPNKPRRRR